MKLYAAPDLIVFARYLFQAAGCDDDKARIIAELLVSRFDGAYDTRTRACFGLSRGD